MLTSVSLTRRSIATKKPCKTQKQRVQPGYELGEFPGNSNKKTQIPPVSAVNFQQQEQEKHYRQEKKKEATCHN
jgi:hypothetical protein